MPTMQSPGRPDPLGRATTQAATPGSPRSVSRTKPEQHCGATIRPTPAHWRAGAASRRPARSHRPATDHGHERSGADAATQWPARSHRRAGSDLCTGQRPTTQCRALGARSTEGNREPRQRPTPQGGVDLGCASRNRICVPSGWHGGATSGGNAISCASSSPLSDNSARHCGARRRLDGRATHGSPYVNGARGRWPFI
jgi:hypothetical protein